MSWRFETFHKLKKTNIVWKQEALYVSSLYQTTQPSPIVFEESKIIRLFSVNLTRYLFLEADSFSHLRFLFLAERKHHQETTLSPLIHLISP